MSRLLLLPPSPSGDTAPADDSPLHTAGASPSIGSRVRLYSRPYFRKYWEGTITALDSGGLVWVEWDDGFETKIAAIDLEEVIDD